MIPAKDLRIGNYVSFGKTAYLDGRKDLYVVEGLNGKSVRIHTNGHRSGLVDYKNVNPIPLTPEILEKAGFRHQVEFDVSQYWSGLPFNSIGFEHISDDWTLCGFEHKPIKHLHQLQNLYFTLTGEELEIRI